MVATRSSTSIRTCSTDAPSCRPTAHGGQRPPRTPANLLAAWHPGGVSGEPPADGTDAGEEFDDWGEPLPSARSKKDQEEQARLAWGSWRQDRELNRRKGLRALVGLVVVSVLAGVVAYGCSILRGPPQLQLAGRVGEFALQPPSSETERLAGRLEATGAQGTTAGRYVGPPGDVVIVAGISDEIPPEVLGQLLPDITVGDTVYDGRGGPLTCGATASGSRCVWQSADVVAGSTAGPPPEELARLSRDLRAGALSR